MDRNQKELIEKGIKILEKIKKYPERLELLEENEIENLFDLMQTDKEISGIIALLPVKSQSYLYSKFEKLLKKKQKEKEILIKISEKRKEIEKQNYEETKEPKQININIKNYFISVIKIFKNGGKFNGTKNHFKNERSFFFTYA